MVSSMARGLTIAVFLLVFVAATRPCTHAVKLQVADAPPAAEEPTGTSSEAEGPDGPAYVELVIKHPYPASSLNSRSGGLPVDPTPDGLPVDPTPEGQYK
ncbi:hypothetical protein ZWY2020_054367 [Hordeum vulgare]|nr:hypothetical protein ZWY2020_054367 [Hordeum vulgare]